MKIYETSSLDNTQCEAASLQGCTHIAFNDNLYKIIHSDLPVFDWQKETSSLMNAQAYGPALAARKKLKNLPDNFLLYNFAWIGDIGDDDNCMMQVTGAEFREAKTGPRKGQLCMEVKGTERKAFLTPKEVSDS
jgi:hypothetical protein